MEKKEFWKGFGVGVAAVTVCALVLNTALIQQFVPWKSLPEGAGMTKSAKLDLIENYIDKYYVDEVDREMMEQGTYAGMMAGVGDRYTYYLTEDNFSQYMENSNGHFEGIGVTVFLDEDGKVTVQALIEGAAAEAAGILVGDIITTVDGDDVTGLELGQVAEMMRGEIGTMVMVGVYRPGSNQQINFEMERAEVVLQSVASRMLNETQGYIRLSGFKENTYDQFMTAFQGLQSQGMKGLVLDLRNNPGGLVRSVYQIGEELLPPGVMVYTEDNRGKREDLICDETYSEIPMVILVNSKSASASEIFAGAAKDTERAIIVGTQTFGKGLVQRLFPLPDGSALNITIQKYFTPKGISIHGTGVTPDVVVENQEGYEDGMYIPAEEDAQLKEGMRQLSGSVRGK